MSENPEPGPTLLDDAQRAMLERMAALDPPPVFMGGFAEDALLAGIVTRTHEDFDWVLPRTELALRREQAESLGFGGFEVWGEAAPGEPFYLFCTDGELKLDLGIGDFEDGGLWMKVHRICVTVGGEPPPLAGYRARLPDDMFDYPPVSLDGVGLRVASPLALYQMRLAIASQGSFGALSDRQRSASQALRERFMAGLPDEQLKPLVCPLDQASAPSE